MDSRVVLDLLFRVRVLPMPGGGVFVRAESALRTPDLRSPVIEAERRENGFPKGVPHSGEDHHAAIREGHAGRIPPSAGHVGRPKPASWRRVWIEQEGVREARENRDAIGEWVAGTPTGDQEPPVREEAMARAEQVSARSMGLDLLDLSRAWIPGARVHPTIGKL